MTYDSKLFCCSAASLISIKTVRDEGYEHSSSHVWFWKLRAGDDGWNSACCCGGGGGGAGAAAAFLLYLARP